MPRLRIGYRRAGLEALLFLVAGADIARNVQFLATAELRPALLGGAEIALLADWRMRRARGFFAAGLGGAAALALGFFLGARFGLAARFLQRADPGLLLLDQPAVGRLH